MTAAQVVYTVLIDTGEKNEILFNVYSKNNENCKVELNIEGNLFSFSNAKIDSKCISSENINGNLSCNQQLICKDHLSFLAIRNCSNARFVFNPVYCIAGPLLVENCDKLEIDGCQSLQLRPRNCHKLQFSKCAFKNGAAIENCTDVNFVMCTEGMDKVVDFCCPFEQSPNICIVP